MVNACRRISLFKHEIEVPNVPLREDVDVHLVPDVARQWMHIRIWWNYKMVHSVSLPLQGFRVHFSSFANTAFTPLYKTLSHSNGLFIFFGLHEQFGY
jgi:hypothetical protein